MANETNQSESTSRRMFGHINGITVIIAVLALIFVTYGVIHEHNKGKAPLSTAAKQGQHILGKGAIITVTDKGEILEKTVIRDTLIGHVQYFQLIIDAASILQITSPYDRYDLKLFALMNSLEHSELSSEQQLEILNSRLRYNDNWLLDEYTTDSAQRVQLWKNARKRYDKLMAMAPPVQIDCLIAEVATFLAKIKRGEYTKPLFHVYAIAVEVPVTDKISYFDTINYVVKYGEKADFRKAFTAELGKVNKYKADNNCN